MKKSLVCVLACICTVSMCSCGGKEETHVEQPVSSQAVVNDYDDESEELQEVADEIRDELGEDAAEFDELANELTGQEDTEPEPVAEANKELFCEGLQELLKGTLIEGATTEREVLYLTEDEFVDKYGIPEIKETRGIADYLYYGSNPYGKVQLAEYRGEMVVDYVSFYIPYTDDFLSNNKKVSDIETATNEYAIEVASSLPTTISKEWFESTDYATVKEIEALATYDDFANKMGNKGIILGLRYDRGFIVAWPYSDFDASLGIENEMLIAAFDVVSGENNRNYSYTFKDEVENHFSID